MNYPKLFQPLLTNKIAFFFASLVILLVLTFSSYPGKSCEKTDTLKIEAKEIESAELSNNRCEKNKPKEECKKFNMMSLNLVYYLMNKYISPKIEKE